MVLSSTVDGYGMICADNDFPDTSPKADFLSIRILGDGLPEDVRPAVLGLFHLVFLVVEACPSICTSGRALIVWGFWQGGWGVLLLIPAFVNLPLLFQLRFRRALPILPFPLPFLHNVMASSRARTVFQL